MNNKKSSKAYRFVILREGTFEKLRTIKVKNWMIFGSVLALIGLWILSLFVLYQFVQWETESEHGSISTDEVLALNEKIGMMEEQLEAQELYISRVQRLLTGEPVVEDSEASLPDQTVEAGSYIPVPRVDEDEMLRQNLNFDAPALPLSVNLENDNPNINQIYLYPPVSGIVSSGFDPKKSHLGVDVMAPQNTPVKSIMEGFVIFSGWTLETGNTIAVQHAYNLVSFYKHNSALLKPIGEYIKAGEALAIIGNTGTLSTGPHLHFELWHNGKPQDPEKYILFR